jgi:trans-2,3-dihydro-3-hydroxyanthranilate isomerase
MDLPFRMVDVFTDRPLAGNQLCVVPDAPPGLEPELMQALAREIGFSETTFVSEADGDRYAMRIFTPGLEMPFAGHPTLGTAFVLASEGRITTPATQVVPAGEYTVEVDVAAGRARLLQRTYELGPDLVDRDRVARSIGLTENEMHPDLPPRVVSTGNGHMIVALRDEHAVVRAAPDTGALVPLLNEVGAGGVYLFSAIGNGTVKARMFAPDVGVMEDPATGSAAGQLGAYLAEEGVGGVPGGVLIRQGEEIGRPSELHLEVTRRDDGFDVWVEGGVVIVGRGTFELPD